ncbi:MAG: DUF2332 domain-containing protein [Thermomicrobiales bacterium]
MPATDQRSEAGSVIIVSNERDRLSASFSRFAALECANAPLYRRLATAVAGDEDLLAIASVAEHGPVPNLFLAAVHDLLLRDHGEGLSEFYPTLATAPRPVSEAPAAFRAFVLCHAERIETTLRQRLVQTNEVRRASVLYLALAWLARRYGLSRIGLIEVGASAGLLLAVDRYDYSFKCGSPDGPPSSRFKIQTRVDGGPRAIAPDLPEIVERIGIDLNVLDIRDEADRRWLQALVWADQPERLVVLDRAMDVARDVPMTLLQGDANLLLPELLDRLPMSIPAVVFHSHTLNQFPAEAGARFKQALIDGSQARDVYRIAMEYEDSEPTLSVTAYLDGVGNEPTRLAHYDAHGSQVRWLES